MALPALKNQALKIAEFFIDLIFPIKCLGCDSEGAWICPECFFHITHKGGQYCFGCREPSQFGEFCNSCRKNYSLDGIVIAGDYEDKFLAHAITTCKYRFVYGIAAPLGHFVSDSLEMLMRKAKLLRQNSEESRPDRPRKMAAEFFLEFSADYAAAPVPLSGKRLKWRGFNQAELLGREIARRHGLAILPRALVRKGKEVQQASLGESARMKNVAGNFECRIDLSGKKILLVDDVVTTGATLNECAKALKSRGAEKVWGVVVAKG